MTGRRYTGHRNNGRSKLPGVNAPDRRVVYGMACTWWGGIKDARHTQAGPRCPGCGGPLLEVPSPEAFWLAVRMFEEGRCESGKEHPGYAEFMRWMERRCFQDVRIACVAYKASTGITIDLDPDEFGQEVHSK